VWPVFVLGPRFSGLVVIQPGHPLVTSGIYRFIRPSELSWTAAHCVRLGPGFPCGRRPAPGDHDDSGANRAYEFRRAIAAIPVWGTIRHRSRTSRLIPEIY
jgi:hypothetical protein